MSLLRRLAGDTAGQRRGRGSVSELYRETHRRILSRLADEVDMEEIADQPDWGKSSLVKEQITLEIESMLEEVKGLNTTELSRLQDDLLNEVFGYGPIQPLLDDDTVTEVMVNGCDMVYVERWGKIEPADVFFNDDNHIRRIIDKIVAPLGRRIDEASPMVDARLPDGSRVNAVIPPISIDGPTLTVRKFRRDPFTAQDLIALGTLSDESVSFLRAATEARYNILVTGGTGSGKTTTLNVLSSFIPNRERIVTIEDAAELSMQQDHVVRMESRPVNIEGTGAVTIRMLVRNSLRMRPDRIIVGECRGEEAFDMLQAMNTGHDGSLTTLHANSPRDVLSRLESMVLMAGMELPIRAIREQISSGIDLIVHQERLKDGSRRVLTISEITGMEGDMIQMQDLFVFNHQGFDDAGRVRGNLDPTGIQPHRSYKFDMSGVTLPKDILRAKRGS